MSAVLSVVLSKPDDRVIEALTYLLDQAKAGRVTWLAYSCGRGTEYSADIVGQTNRMIQLTAVAAVEEAVESLRA